MPLIKRPSSQCPVRQNNNINNNDFPFKSDTYSPVLINTIPDLKSLSNLRNNLPILTSRHADPQSTRYFSDSDAPAVNYNDIATQSAGLGVTAFAASNMINGNDDIRFRHNVSTYPLKKLHSNF